MNVLIILGHPRKQSFSGALADAYREGALDAAMDVRQLNLADMSFNPNVITPSPRHQESEDGISQAQNLILWADHLVFVYPTWWGTMPALLKGFLDRVFTPGFAFEELEESQRWEKLLKGKSAQLITTMDTPLWVYRWIYKTPGHNAIGQATLQFCGISPVRTLSFSPIKHSSTKQREAWLDLAKQKGKKLEDGILNPWEIFFGKLTPWIKAIRLQFYPMTWIAYAAGAYGAAKNGYLFDPAIFWLGYLWLFLIELATVLSNDYFDFNTDKQNKFYSPFTGGSRVLVDQELTPNQVRKGVVYSLLISLVFATALIGLTAGKANHVIILLLIMSVLALGYTVPPLKLSYRGLGELDVGITHSLGVILCGYVFLGGDMNDPFPWLLSLPLFLGTLPSIILAGIPDYEADKAVGKGTLAVKLGRQNAITLACVSTLLSAVSGTAWYALELLPEAFGPAILVTVPHAILLFMLLYRYNRLPSPPPRIDGLMIVALTYVIWFGLIPLIYLM